MRYPETVDMSMAELENLGDVNSCDAARSLAQAAAEAWERTCTARGLVAHQGRRNRQYDVAYRDALVTIACAILAAGGPVQS